jgi:hypothetical protein
MFTTRTRSDHELYARNLVTGAEILATSTLDSGAAGTIPEFMCISGGQTFNATTAKIYMGAFWARGMTTAEMREIARDPWGFTRRPSVPRVLRDATPIPVVGDLNATLGSVALASTGTVEAIADFTTTLGALGLSADVQVGAGVLGSVGDLGIQIGDLTLSATATVDVIAELSESLGAITLNSAVIAGSNGPFARRPAVVMN